MSDCPDLSGMSPVGSSALTCFCLYIYDRVFFTWVAVVKLRLNMLTFLLFGCTAPWYSVSFWFKVLSLEVCNQSDLSDTTVFSPSNDGMRRVVPYTLIDFGLSQYLRCNHVGNAVKVFDGINDAALKGGPFQLLEVAGVVALKGVGAEQDRFLNSA